MSIEQYICQRKTTLFPPKFGFSHLSRTRRKEKKEIEGEGQMEYSEVADSVHARTCPQKTG